MLLQYSTASTVPLGNLCLEPKPATATVGSGPARSATHRTPFYSGSLAINSGILCVLSFEFYTFFQPKDLVSYFFGRCSSRTTKKLFVYSVLTKQCTSH